MSEEMVEAAQTCACSSLPGRYFLETPDAELSRFQAATGAADGVVTDSTDLEMR